MYSHREIDFFLETCFNVDVDDDDGVGGCRLVMPSRLLQAPTHTHTPHNTLYYSTINVG